MSTNYDPKGIGERTEAQVLAVFLRHGKTVLKPFGDNQRYDLVVDENGRFVRVQCKTARHASNGSYEFDVCSTNWNTKKRRTYEGQCDVFAVYIRELDCVCIVPVVECTNKRQMTLRQENSINAPNGKSRLIRDYLFDASKLYASVAQLPEQPPFKR